ncbi:MAG: single-stranded-DNA-specific exonuclease RecJ [Chloroflexi bacterium]|nr:single-stranded-DNA-specific exonuclease RecJ [Chloroflexota bacterium]
MRWIEATPPRTPVGHSLSPAPLPDLHPLVSQTLIRRGLTSAEAARAFLSPDHYNPTPATQLPGLSTALDRIQAAIRAREPICVWGDFDVDGQTATTILVSTLQALGADVTYHIPVRAKESHGVNIPHLAEIIEHGAKLILTCDTGITAHQAVDYARSRGVDVVITDHHDLPVSMPQAAAIVNPKFLPVEHPLASLSGAGVAYKLAEALLESGESGMGVSHALLVTLHSLLDLAAMGLVADLAILRADARYLVQKGLQVLRSTPRLGLKVMLEIAELTPAHISEEHIGFTLAPRLNALGRLGDANPAVELFTTRDPARARLLATQLEGLNAQRQLLTRQVTLAAEAQLRADPALLDQPIIVLSHPSWPGGVIGIAASHLVDRYHRPVILFSAPANEPARGSARSIEGINITDAIAAQRDMLLNYGGHPMAAGLSLEAEKLPAFRKAISKTVAGMTGEVEIEPTLEIDGWLDLPALDLTLSESIEQLAPFGPGNEKLILATHNLRLKSAAEIGRNKEHLKLTVEDEHGNAQTVLWWNGGGEELPDLISRAGGRFDLAYTLRASDWRGTRQVTLEFVDLRLIEEKPVEVTKPAIEVIDYRGVEKPLETLARLHPSLLSGQAVETFACTCAGTSERSSVKAIIWAEGADKKEVFGRDRLELERADVLAIWTTPPGRDVLRAAIERVKPRTVYLFAVSPTDRVGAVRSTYSAHDTPKAFLRRLAGLAKFAILKKSGRTHLSELAAACAQPEIAVRLGLEWLAANGNIVFEADGDALHLSIGNQAANQYLPKADRGQELSLTIQALLAETRAYRTFFTRADKDTLLTDYNTIEELK